MKVAAFDVGVRNLAWCTMDDGEGILAWRNAVVGGQTIEAHVRSVHDLLSVHAADFEVDVVLVERQTGANTRMMCLASALLMRFLERATPVEFVDPRHKLTGLPDLPAPTRLPRSAHRRNKVEAVERVRLDLSHEGWRAFFESAAKKDDLADSYGYARSFLERERAVVV